MSEWEDMGGFEFRLNTQACTPVTGPFLEWLASEIEVGTNNGSHAFAARAFNAGVDAVVEALKGREKLFRGKFEETGMINDLLRMKVK